MNAQAVTAFLRKNPIGIGCLLIVIVLGVVVFLRSGSLPELKQTLADKTTEGRRLADNITYATQLKRQYAAVAAAGKEAESRLVTGSELARNLQYFYKLEADTGSKIVELRQQSVASAVKAKAKNDKFIGVQFIVGIEGDYRAALDFLRRLETGEHYSRFTSLTMGPVGNQSGTRGGPVRVNFNVELLGQP